MASDHEYSGSDSDNGLDEDMEALRRAIALTGTNPEHLATSTVSSIPFPDNDENESDDDDDEDDLQLVRSLQQRFSISNVDNEEDELEEEPLSLKPLCTILPDCEDDFELLRAIQQRFSQYNDTVNKSTESTSEKHEQVGATYIDSEKESSNNLFVERTNNGEGFPDCVDASVNTQNLDPTVNICLENPPSGSIEWHNSVGEVEAVSPDRNFSFPKSAQAFVDAIKKNRSCQTFIRKMLMHIESRIEENQKLISRVKMLRDFQVACRKRTGRALSRKRDARIQLISVPKLRANAKVEENKHSALYYGPAENSQVANYRMALKKFPLVLNRRKWSKEEKENLAKGIKQQFQEMLLQKSVDLFSGGDGDSNEFDNMILSIRDHDITPENIRSFLPKVNWDQLASMYVSGRSGAECESRWLNCEDPLIDHRPWTRLEDKNLLYTVQQNGMSNWIDIAVSLGTNRTPFQCLARYQRSLNASILKREWTEEEDEKLHAAVTAFGESNWQVVASTMEGRTGTQCSNRWTKTLNPIRKRTGKWSSDEDKRLKIAAMLFEGKNWHKIAQFVQGRTQVQCRERWFNKLDPTLNLEKWTKEEDSRLEAAIREQMAAFTEKGYTWSKISWSKVAACVFPRTDSQCLRRWVALNPYEASLHKAARKVQKEALISNFVDRESERPALGPDDFVPMIELVPESKNLMLSKKRKRKQRLRAEQNEKESSSVHVPKRRSRRHRKESHKWSDKSFTLTDDDVGVLKKRVKRKSRLTDDEPAPLSRDHLPSSTDTALLSITNGEEVRALGKDILKKKKNASKKQKRKSRAREEPQEIERVSKVDHISNHNRLKRPRSNECSKLTCIGSTEFGDKEIQVINKLNEIEATSIDDDLFMNKIREIKKLKDKGANRHMTNEDVDRHKKNKGTDPAQDHSTCLNSMPLRESGVEVEVINCCNNMEGEPYSSKSPDLSSVCQILPSCHAMLETDMLTCEDVNASGDYSTALPNERPRNSTPDIVDGCNLRSFSGDRPQRSRRSKTKNRACSEKSKAKGRACSKKKVKTEDDDITLASFLLQAREHRMQALLYSNAPRQQLKSGTSNAIVESSQNFRLAPNCSTSYIPDKWKSSSSGACKQHIMSTRAKGRKRTGSCQKKSETQDEDDVTLASFKIKLKKRKLE